MGILFSIFVIASGHAANLQKIQLPKQVIDSIKKDYNVERSETQPEMVDVNMEIKTRLATFKLQLGDTQESLDLAHYINTVDKGVQIKMSTPFTYEPQNTSMYFISRYKPFTAQTGKEYGYPCGTVYKLSTRANEFLNADALNIMTNTRQYLSILGGDYLVLHMDKEAKRLKMSYFKVRDARWTHELCKLDY